MFNKFLLFIILIVTIFNIILIYIGFIKGAKITVEKKEEGGDGSSPPPPPTTSKNYPFDSEIPGPVVSFNGKNINISKECIKYTYEDNETNNITFSNLYKKININTDNVFNYVYENKTQIYYNEFESDCYDQDELFVQRMTHTCSEDSINRCFSVTGKVISPGQKESYNLKCNNSKCDGEIGHLSFNFNLTTNKFLNNNVVINNTTRYLSLTGVCLGVKLDSIIKNTPFSPDYTTSSEFTFISDSVLKNYQSFVTNNLINLNEDEYNFNYGMVSNINNDFNSKFKIIRYNYNIGDPTDITTGSFGVCARGLYGSIIFRPLNMYLTLGRSPDTKEERIIHNKIDINNKLSANLVLKKYDKNNYEDSIVWMLLPSMNLSKNLIPTKSRCNYYKHSPQECLIFPFNGTKITNSIVHRDILPMEYINPNDSRRNDPTSYVNDRTNWYVEFLNVEGNAPVNEFAINPVCDNSFLRTQVNIGDIVTVTEDDYVLHTITSSEDDYVVRPFTNIIGNDFTPPTYNTWFNSPKSEYLLYSKGTNYFFPYYAPLANISKSDIPSDIGRPGRRHKLSELETKEYKEQGYKLDPFPFVAQTLSGNNIFCIENKNGDIKTKEQILKYPKIAHQALTGGYVSNTELLDIGVSKNVFLDDTISKFANILTGDKFEFTSIPESYTKFLPVEQFNGGYLGEVNDEKRQVLMQKEIPNREGSSFTNINNTFEDGQVVWKYINPYENVITFPKEYFLATNGLVEALDPPNYQNSKSRFLYKGYGSSLNGSISEFTYTVDNVFNLSWGDQILEYSYDKSNKYALFNVIIQNQQVQQIVLQEGSKGFDDNDIKNGILLDKPNVKNILLPNIGVSISSIENKNYSYVLTGGSGTDIGICQLGVIKEDGTPNNLTITNKGLGYKKNDTLTLIEYDFLGKDTNTLPGFDNAKLDVSTVSTTSSYKSFAFDPIDAPLLNQNTDTTSFLGDLGFRMVEESDESNYSTNSPPQLCFMGDYIKDTGTISKILDNGEYDTKNAKKTIDIFKQILPEFDLDKFIGLFNLMKQDEFSTETSLDFLKTLQFEDLNYSGVSGFSINYGSNLFMGKFIPYSQMVLFNSPGTSSFNITPNGEIPGQHSSGDYSDKLHEGEPAYMVANKGKTIFYNDNYTQFIPYGLDDLNDLTSF